MCVFLIPRPHTLEGWGRVTSPLHACLFMSRDSVILLCPGLFHLCKLHLTGDYQERDYSEFHYGKLRRIRISLSWELLRPRTEPLTAPPSYSILAQSSARLELQPPSAYIFSWSHFWETDIILLSLERKNRDTAADTNSASTLSYGTVTKAQPSGALVPRATSCSCS